MDTDFKNAVKKIFGTTDLNELEKIAKNVNQINSNLGTKQNIRGAGRKKRFDDNDIVNMAVLHNAGRPIQQIAAYYGTSRQTISHYLQELHTAPANLPYNYRLNYMNGNQLCTVIYVDFKNEKIMIKNYTNKLILRAFGIIEHPTWDDFELFLKDRCLPQSRANLKLILRDIGLDFYDPLNIIDKTEGRMAGDNQWIQVVPLNRRKATMYGKHQS